jgi:hypothetical protein
VGFLYPISNSIMPITADEVYSFPFREGSVTVLSAAFRQGDWRRLKGGGGCATERITFLPGGGETPDLPAIRANRSRSTGRAPA